MSRHLRGVASLTLRRKLALIDRLYEIHASIACPHKQEEVLEFMRAIYTLPDDHSGVVVEAGCYKGGSTAKFSIACAARSRKLYVFDSFEGIPENSEEHGISIFGASTRFDPGDYCGALEEVRKNVHLHGNIESCNFVKGWFEDTMPHFREPVAAAYLDCDLQSSTRTCLKHLYPLLQTGGKIYSQDRHLPLVIQVFEDDDFWKREIGISKPQVHGLGKNKVIHIVKE